MEAAGFLVPARYTNIQPPLHARIVLLLDVLQPLLCSGTLTYLEPNLFLVFKFYNGNFLIFDYSFYV
jgi:hypothetical protein